MLQLQQHNQETANFVCRNAFNSSSYKRVKERRVNYDSFLLKTLEDNKLPISLRFEKRVEFEHFLIRVI